MPVKHFLNHIWNSHLGLSLSAGIILGLSFPPFPFPFLVIPAFLLLFRLAEISSSYRQLAYYSFPGFVVWNIVVTYWLTFATVAGGVAAILANAILMTIPLVIIRYLLLKFRSFWLIPIVIAATWVSYEFLHHRWDLAWPWLTLANAFSNAPGIVQYISVTGSLGISFWIVWAASAIWFALRTPSFQTRLYAIFSFIVLPIVSIFQFSFSDYQKHNSGHINVAIIQPNFDSYLHLAGYPDAIMPLEELLTYTAEIISEHNYVEVVYWPENALQATVVQDQTGRQDVLIQRFTNDFEIPLITGSSFLRRYDHQPKLTRGIYAGKPYNVYNAALAYFPNRTMEFYEKAKLVPIVERMPFVYTLQALDFFSGYDWGRNAGFGRGNTPVVFHTKNGASPAMVCYDSVFPDWVRRFTREGANYLTVITNDGWWGNTSGHIQHFDYARLRAIENNRTVLRSANNGISGMITNRGDVVKATEYWTRDGFVVTVPLYANTTFYVKYGDWLGVLSTFIVFILLSFATYQRYLGRS